MADNTETLFSRLKVLDDEEDQILAVLLQHGAALEEAQRRMNMVLVADLLPLRDGMAALEETIDTLQAKVTLAEDKSMPPAPPPEADGNGHDAATSGPVTNGAEVAADPPPAPGSTSPAPVSGAPANVGVPAPTDLVSMTLAQLAARIREQDQQAARLREALRERLLALGALPADSDAAVPAPESGTAAPPPERPDVVVVPAAPRTFKLRDKPMTGDDVKAFQHDLNRRFRAWGIKHRVSEDGVYDRETRLAARRALRGLGLDLEDPKRGITPELQRLVHKPSLRTPEQLARAQANRGWLRNLKASLADGRPIGTTKPKPPPAGSVQAAIRKHGGRYEDIIAREAKRHRLPISLVCAVIEKESSFRNVYGRDRGSRPNPVRSPDKGVLEVTQANYKAYLKHRNAGKDPNGVGPMQLTFPPFQDRADNLGGCWKVGPNIRVGCEVLADNIKRLGSTREGVRAYNGSGDKARKYAASVLAMQAVWHERLKGKPTAPPAEAPDKPTRPARPRTFKVKGSMHGKDVRGWQNTLRRQFRTWRVDYPLAVDGYYGPITRSATSDVLKGLGIAQETMLHGVTPELRIKVRSKRLTPSERARYAARAGWRRRLRKRFAHKAVAPPINKILTSSHGFKPGHDGVDLICGENVPIMAICDAEVIDVRGGGWWGKSPTGNVSKGDGIIQLKCLSDVGPFKRGMHFGYGHAEHPVVRKGQRIKAGDVIGKAGFANAWHIHFMANGGGTMRGIGDRDPMPYVRYAMKRGR